MTAPTNGERFLLAAAAATLSGVLGSLARAWFLGEAAGFDRGVLGVLGAGGFTSEHGEPSGFGGREASLLYARSAAFLARDLPAASNARLSCGSKRDNAGPNLSTNNTNSPSSIKRANFRDSLSMS